MRLKALLADDENAVSPVIGVILMVAITVILAAVIASFVLGLGPSSAAPTVNFDNSFDSTNNELTVEITGGDTVTAGELSFTGDVGSGQSDGDTWADVDSGSLTSESEIGAGDSVTLTGVSSGYEINVVWESEDGGTSQTLTTFEG